MQAEDDEVWRNQLRKYIRSVEILTVKALKVIKRDRIRSNLPFDGAFQKYFLQKTNAQYVRSQVFKIFDLLQID